MTAMLLVFSGMAYASEPLSDDFNYCTINPIWEFINPVGNGNYSVNGTNLQITVPQGTDHDVWIAGNRAPRLMQDIDNTDFEIEAKFESALTSKYQLQGIIIEQDTGNFIRTDYYTDGTTIRLFITTFTNGTPRLTAIFNGPVTGNYIKIARAADNWRVNSSNDGSSWTQRANFNHTITTTKAGVFAGNAGSNPAHNASIDYFFNTASRITPEDNQTTTKTLTKNIIGNGTINPSQSQYTCNAQVMLTAQPNPGYVFTEWTDDASGNNNTVKIFMDTDKTVTATFTIKFDTKSNTGHDIQIFLHNDNSPYTIYGLSETFDLGTSYQAFTKEFTTPANANTPRLRIWFIGSATAGDIYYFDAFELTETNQTTPITNNTITISNINVSTTTNSAQINWTTDKTANSIIQYGLTTYTENITNQTETTTHTINIPALQQNTTYHYKIISNNQNASANTTDATFTTTTNQTTPITNNTNILANPGFESGTSPWAFYTNGAGTYTTTTDATEGANAAKIEIASIGTNTQLYQKNFVLKPNTKYTIKFDAKSNTGHDIQIFLHNDNSPYTIYGLSETFDLGTSYQAFTKEFTTPANANTPRLRIWFIGSATAGDIYYFDAFELTETNQTTPITNNTITISNINVSTTTNSAQINWTTDKTANSIIQYGLTTYTENITNQTETTTHTINIPALQQNTTYHYKIISNNQNASANTTDATFTTTTNQTTPITNNTITNITSDDFNICTLNNTLWEFVNPVGDGSYKVNGTNLLISVPQGTDHDIW